MKLLSRPAWTRKDAHSTLRDSAGTSVWLASAFVALLVAVPYANLILYHFYVQGAFFWDVGVFAGVLWHQAISLPTPLLFGNAGSSLFATHIMPLFVVLNRLSWLTPLTMPIFFAAVIGIGHALPSVAVLRLLIKGVGLRGPFGLASAVLLAVGFGFSGIALAIIRFPHPEILIVGGVLLFAASIALEEKRAACCFFVATLLIREDSGLHLFGLLLLLTLANMWRGRSWREQRAYWLFAVTGLGYAMAAILLQHLLFKGDVSAFTQVYTGNPPFHDLTFRTVTTRLLGLLVFRPYIVAPALVALIWALRAQNSLIMVGYAAFLPWLVLQSVAHSRIAGTLSGYYAFPFLIAAGWPLVAVVMDARQRRVPADRRAALIGFSLMLAASFLGVGSQWVNDAPIPLLRGLTNFPHFTSQTATDKAVATLVVSRNVILGQLAIDESIVALAPYGFPLDDAVDAQGTKIRPDTIAYFCAGPEHRKMEERLSELRLTFYYVFDNTSLCLASNRDLSGLPGVRIRSPQ